MVSVCKPKRSTTPTSLARTLRPFINAKVLEGVITPITLILILILANGPSLLVAGWYAGLTNDPVH